MTSPSTAFDGAFARVASCASPSGEGLSEGKDQGGLVCQSTIRPRLPLKGREAFVVPSHDNTEIGRREFEEHKTGRHVARVGSL